MATDSWEAAKERERAAFHSRALLGVTLHVATMLPLSALTCSNQHILRFTCQVLSQPGGAISPALGGKSPLAREGAGARGGWGSGGQVACRVEE